MLKADALPSVCATNQCSPSPWFDCLDVIMRHPHLSDDEKSLWLWFATQSANRAVSYCTFSYKQISLTLSLPCNLIHRALSKFRCMGFLEANTNIPIWYGKLTPAMESELRILVPVTPSKILLAHWEKNIKEANECVFSAVEGRKKMSLNLLGE